MEILILILLAVVLFGPGVIARRGKALGQTIYELTHFGKGDDR